MHLQIFLARVFPLYRAVKPRLINNLAVGSGSSFNTAGPALAIFRKSKILSDA